MGVILGLYWGYMGVILGLYGGYIGGYIRGYMGVECGNGTHGTCPKSKPPSEPEKFSQNRLSRSVQFCAHIGHVRPI